ncbi:MAG: glycosyltransferase [Candidatus Omnitrophica bacterium]|nr:glycosyltransferase [Candidatus Omnitrophota bacterium]
MDYKFVVIYIGAFGYKNKPSILLDCAKRLAKDNICFVLVGDGEAFKEIKERAAMSRNVVLTGWLDPDEITALLEHSHVGVCIPTPQADAFPNKAFAYLSAGLPVVSAFCGDMKDIIEKYQAGYYYSPDNMGALTDSIRLLCEDKGLYERMSENARKLYDEKFNSDILYEEYAKHIEAVAKMTKNEISAR